MTDSIKESPKRGGMRPSAGRKPQYDEPTAVIRVPVSKKQLVKDFLKTGVVDGNSGLLAFPTAQQDLSSEAHLPSGPLHIAAVPTAIPILARFAAQAITP